MSVKHLLAACAAAAALFAAAPAAAQSVVCCNLSIDVKGKWVGTGRECAGGLEQASPEVLAKICPLLANCPEAKDSCPSCEEQINRLKGRIRGLGEAALAHRTGENDARLKRIDARDRLWGKGEGLKFEGGSISGFGEAMLDSVLLATGGGGSVGQAYSSVRKNYKDARDWAEKGWKLGSNPGDVEQWTGLGQEFIGMHAEDVLRKRTADAYRAGRETYSRTRNYVSAQNAYRRSYGNYGALNKFKGKADKFAGALNKLSTLYEKTDKLANDAQDWIDAYGDQQRADKEIGKIEAEIDRLTKAREKLSAACKLSGDPSRYLDMPRSWPAARAFVLRTAAKAQGGGSANDLVLQRTQAALGRLRQMQGALRALDSRVGALVIEPFSPWLAGNWRDAEPRELLVALVKAARDDLRQFDSLLGKLESAGDAAYKAVRNVPRDTVN